MRAVWLYPSICYFEATAVSLGRGGDHPFQMLTYPDGTVVDLRTSPPDDEVIGRGIDLSYLIEAYRAIGDKPGTAGGPGKKFLSPFFENLMGVDRVRSMIEGGSTAAEIEASWAPDVARFREQRKPYLLYN